MLRFLNFFSEICHSATLYRSIWSRSCPITRWPHPIINPVQSVSFVLSFCPLLWLSFFFWGQTYLYAL